MRTYGDYVAEKGVRADEEVLVEPVLQQFMERVLGFPVDGYFPQWGRGGVKPDLTPIDLIAHSFVLDAKSSDEDLGRHEPQIRRYITQRSLEYGILFNLGELRVYRRNEKRHDPELSFSLLSLWQLARREALAAPERDPFERFCARFAYREMALADKVDWVRRQKPWSLQLDADPHIEVDVEFLVRRLHDLSRDLTDDAAVHSDQLDRFLTFMPAREEKVLGELRQIALDVAPGTSRACPKDYASGEEPPICPGECGASTSCASRISLSLASSSTGPGRTSSSWISCCTTAALTRPTIGCPRAPAASSTRRSNTVRTGTAGSSARTTTMSGTGRVRPCSSTFSTRSRRSRSASSTPTSSGRSTSRTWTRSTVTGSASSSRRDRSSGSGRLQGRERCLPHRGQRAQASATARLCDRLRRLPRRGCAANHRRGGCRRRRYASARGRAGGDRPRLHRRRNQPLSVLPDRDQSLASGLAPTGRAQSSRGREAAAVRARCAARRHADREELDSGESGRRPEASRRPRRACRRRDQRSRTARRGEARPLPATPRGRKLRSGRWQSAVRHGGEQQAALPALVRKIAQNRRALLPHRAAVRDLGRIVKDPWKVGPVEIDPRALLAELPAAETVSVRLDPGLEATVGAGALGKPHREAGDALVFRRGKADTGRVTGDEARLDLLEELLGGKAPDDLSALLLPRDLAAFEEHARERAKVVTDLLAEGRQLVEEVERLVCALYELPDELTDEVVAHAVARAGSLSADQGE